MNEVAELELPTQGNFRADLRTLFRGAVRVALEVALEDELREMVGAKKWERQAQLAATSSSPTRIPILRLGAALEFMRGGSGLPPGESPRHLGERASLV